MKTLKNWASEKEIWKKESWREFVEELEDTLREAKKILKIDKLFEEVEGKEIGDITDERLKEKVMTALLGGTDLPESPFSRLMYKKFGIKLGEASSWEESVETYRRLGKWTKIRKEDKRKCWIGHVENLAEDLETLIKEFEGKGLKLEPKEEEDIDPLDYLPSRGERPDKLKELINTFAKKVNRLALGTNPFVTFVTFVRFNYVDNVLKFLSLNRIEELRELIELLDLKLVDAIHLEFKKLEDYETGKHFLLYGREGLSGLIYEKLACGSDIYKFVERRKVEEWMKQNLMKAKVSLKVLKEMRSSNIEVKNGMIQIFKDPVNIISIIDSFNKEIIPLSEMGVLTVEKIGDYIEVWTSRRGYTHSTYYHGLKININFPDVLNELLRNHETDQEREA